MLEFIWITMLHTKTSTNTNTAANTNVTTHTTATTKILLLPILLQTRILLLILMLLRILLPIPILRLLRLSACIFMASARTGSLDTSTTCVGVHTNDFCPYHTSAHTILHTNDLCPYYISYEWLLSILHFILMTSFHTILHTNDFCPYRESRKNASAEQPTAVPGCYDRLSLSLSHKHQGGGPW